jgi:hypothetical protein
VKISGVKFVQGRNGYSDGDGHKYGIAVHNTSNNAAAANEASYATRRTDGTSAHFYVDRTEVIQSLDTRVKAGHAGSREGNENAVAVEIVGVNGKTRQWWLDNVCWDNLGAALAVVCRNYGVSARRASVAEMKANPKVRAFYSHDDMRRAWGGTTHTDPGDGFCWDRLFEAVNAHLPSPTNPTTGAVMLPINGTLPRLERGMSDPVQGFNYVWRLQLMLKIPADGDYGPATARAVQTYNKDVLGRKTDGATVDAAFWKRLLAIRTPAATGSS